jgi:hypothetical protein
MSAENVHWSNSIHTVFSHRINQERLIFNYFFLIFGHFKVEGLILNRQGEAKFCLEGYWDQYINIAPVIGQKMEGNRKYRIEAGQPRRIWNANPPK